MRHVLLPGAITAGTRGMQKPTAVACLIAPAGSTSSVTSGLTGTIPGAVDVAAIAAAADRYLNAAAGTKEQPRRDKVVLIEPAGPPMTGAAIAAILPRHACPGTVWCTVPKRNLAVWTSAPCLPPIVRTGDACTSRFDQQCRRTAKSVLPLTPTQMDGTPSRADPIPAADHRPASPHRRNVARFTRIPATIDSSSRFALKWFTASRLTDPALLVEMSSSSGSRLLPLRIRSSPH